MQIEMLTCLLLSLLFFLLLVTVAVLGTRRGPRARLFANVHRPRRMPEHRLHDSDPVLAKSGRMARQRVHTLRAQRSAAVPSRRLVRHRRRHCVVHRSDAAHGRARLVQVGRVPQSVSGGRQRHCLRHHRRGVLHLGPSALCARPTVQF